VRSLGIARRLAASHAAPPVYRKEPR